MKSSIDSSAAGVYRLLLVDDHPALRQGLARMIETEQDLFVAASTGSATEALACLRTAKFDLAIIDISLHGLSGIDLLQDLKIHWPKMPVLVFSMHDELAYAERALRVGARGYLMKHASAENILGAIRRVLKGNLAVSEATYSRLLSTTLQGGCEPSTPSSIVGALSNRELEVFRLIGHGQGTREIARQMHISMKTVDTYRAHIKRKLQLSTPPEVMRAAIEWIRSS